MTDEPKDTQETRRPSSKKPGKATRKKAAKKGGAKARKKTTARPRKPPGETPTGAQETGKRRYDLPSFGLARDVLPALASETGGREEEKPLLPPAGPHRVYAFADSLAREEGEEAVPEPMETWVLFSLEGDTYGLPVSHIQEILRVTSITRVPHAPFPVRGITNMRGRVIPVVDLGLRLALPEREITSQSRILVASSRGRVIGLLVDGVEQVIQIVPSRIQPTPPDAVTERSDYIQGVYQLDQALAILLDVDRVLLVRDEE